MVTKEELNEHLGSQPFSPFRVVLCGGEIIEVVRRAQGVVLARDFMVGIAPSWRGRRVPLAEIDRIEPAELKKTG
jgi:hypothetical protein